MIRSLPLAVLTALGMLSACGRTPVLPPDPCEGLTCPAGTACDPDQGRCVTGGGQGDGGATDAGSDAGTSDAGADAGILDAGVDAGTDAGTDAGMDAGMDAGVDAGTDAGTMACASGCPPTQFCDVTANNGAGACVTCTATQGCSGATSLCDTSVMGGQCVGCLSNTDCQNPDPICSLTSKTCGPCTGNSQCASGTYCASGGSCLVVPDTCATAQAINFGGAASVSFTADTALGQDDVQGTCNGSGAELVYRFTLASPGDVTITATRGSSGFANPVIYLRSSPCGSGTQLACENSASTAGGTETISLLNQPAGDYFLFVEGVGTAVGPTDVTITLGGPTPSPPNDTCAGAQTLTFVNDQASATGTTVGATNGNLAGAVTPTCSSTARQTGWDVVYQFTLTQSRDVTVTVTPTSAGYRPAVYMRAQNSCGSDTQVACAAASATGSIAPQTLQVANVPAGTWYLWVDGVADTSGTFQLDVVLGSPTTNDSCASPEALAFVNDVATTTGDTRFGTNDNSSGHVSPTCSTSAKVDGRDLVYSYTLPGTRNVSITVTPTGANPTYQPVVYVRSPGNCASTGSATQLACVSNVSTAPASIQLTNQAAGTYFIWVDGSEQTAGPFGLQVTLTTPPPVPGDDCPGAPLTFVNGVASVSASTTPANNSNGTSDALPTCSTSAKNTGRDLIYSYTLTSPQDVQVSISPTTVDFLPVLYVKRGTCTSNAISDELTCVSATTSGAIGSTLLNQPAGTYWVFVDGGSGSHGNFVLDVALFPPTPPPPNDECAGAQVLSFTNGVAQASGDTTTASNSNSASDASPVCSPTAKQKGRDLVYRYALTTAQDVTVTITPSGTNNPYVPVGYVRGPGTSACTSVSAGTEQGCTQAGGPGPLTFTLLGQAAGTYFLFADGANDTFGPFNVSVTLGPPTVLPETCATAFSLTIGQTISGDTTPAVDDYSRNSSPAYGTACTSNNSYPFTGRDLVYEFTATATSHVATLTVSQNFDPALMFIRPPPGQTCSPAYCADFSDAIGNGASETLSMTGLTVGQKYFLVVDNWNAGAGFNSGSFTLTVQ
jgi:hypothetical protein